LLFTAWKIDTVSSGSICISSSSNSSSLSSELLVSRLLFSDYSKSSTSLLLFCSFRLCLTYTNLEALSVVSLFLLAVCSSLYVENDLSVEAL